METIYHLVTVPLEKKKALKNALQTTEGLSGWWTSNTEQPQPRLFRFHFEEGYFKDFRVLQDADKQVVWECVEGHPEWKGTHITFDIQEGEGKNTIHFRHSNWKAQTPMFGICNYHWALFMKSLKDFVETGKGNPADFK